LVCPITNSKKTEQHIIIPLNPTQLQQYRDEGYCLVRNLIPSAVGAAVRQRTLAVIADLPAWGNRACQVLDPQRYQNHAGQPLPAGIQLPAQEEAVFQTMADHPNLATAMGQLLGGAVQRFTDQVGIKHGCIKEAQGGCSYYHQDSYYWHIKPELGCNCWISLDSVGTNAIALAVIPGSQKGWRLVEHESYDDDPPLGGVRAGKFTAFQRHRVPLKNVDLAQEVLLPMEPGDGLFFTNYTWHRSEPNRTGQTKAFYAIAYQRAPQT